MRATPHEQHSCSSCGYLKDTASEVISGGRFPKKGDVSICGGLETFDISPFGLLIVRESTDIELTKYSKDPRITAFLAEMRKYWNAHPDKLTELWSK